MSVLSEGSFDRVSHVGAVRLALQQSRGGAMLRGVSVDQSGGCQEHHEEWRMRRLAELSSDDLTQEEPADVSPVAWNRSRSPQRWGAWRHRQSTVGKGFFDGVPVVAPPCNTGEITGHQVHFFVKHHCTNRKNKLLSYATFLGVNVNDVQRQNCECFLAAEKLSEKRHVIARPVKTHPESPSVTFSGNSRLVS